MAALRIREAVSGTDLPMVAISTPNLALVGWLGDATGTKVTSVTRAYTKDGCSLHCPTPHVHVHSVTGRWSLTGVRATVLLANIVPYMQLQVEVAEQLLALGLRSPRKPATITKMAELGWTAPTFLPVAKPGAVGAAG